MIKHFCFFISTIVLLVAFQQSKAQDTIETNEVTNQLWFDLNPIWSLGKRFDLYGDVAYRTVFPYEWEQFAIAPSVRYRPRFKIRDRYFDSYITAGIRYHYTNNKASENIMEIRPFQGYWFRWPNGNRFFIRHYIRLEERFQYRTDNWDLIFGMRGRYRASMNLKLTGDFVSFTKGFFIPFHVEMFFNFAEVNQFNDVLRVSPGIGYELNHNWNLSAHVAYHYMRNVTEDVLQTNDIVYRIRLIRKLYGTKDIQ